MEFDDISKKEIKNELPRLAFKNLPVFSTPYNKDNDIDVNLIRSKRHLYSLIILHNNIQKIIKQNKSNDNDIDNLLKLIKNELNSCKYLNEQKEYISNYNLTQQQIAGVKDKSNNFYNTINEFDYNNKRIFNDNLGFTAPFFLTVIGAKPSCIVQNQMCNLVINSDNELFNKLKYKQISNGYSLLYSPDQLLKIINHHRHIFKCDIKDEKELEQYVNNNNLSDNYYSNKNIEESLSEEYYIKHLISGLVLGFPLPQVIKFAALQPFVDQYLNIYKKIEFDIDYDGKYMNEFDYSKINIADIAKKIDKKRDEYIKTAINESDRIPEELKEILIDYKRVTFNDKACNFAFCKFDDNDNYEKMINKIFNATDFFEKMRS